MAQANSFAKRFPGSDLLARPAVGPGTAQLDQLRHSAGRNYDQLLERAAWFYEAVKLLRGDEEPDAGQGPGLPRCLHRRGGLHGSTASKAYTLHVPAEPPAQLFWSATVYDAWTTGAWSTTSSSGATGALATPIS